MCFPDKEGRNDAQRPSGVSGMRNFPQFRRWRPTWSQLSCDAWVFVQFPSLKPTNKHKIDMFELPKHNPTNVVSANISSLDV